MDERTSLSLVERLFEKRMRQFLAAAGLNAPNEQLLAVAKWFYGRGAMDAHEMDALLMTEAVMMNTPGAEA